MQQHISNNLQLNVKLQNLLQRFSLNLPDNFYKDIPASLEFLPLYRALIGNDNDLLLLIEEALGPECYEKRADKVIDDRLHYLRLFISENDFYLLRQCFLTAFYHLAGSLNKTLRQKVQTALKIEENLDTKSAQELLSLLLEIIAKPIPQKLNLPNDPDSYSSYEPQTEIPNQESNEEIMGKIRNLLADAANKARAANLVPDATSELKISTKETEVIKEKEEAPIIEEEIKDENVASENNETSFTKLSLKDLADRAAKLQQEFRSERRKLAEEGKLPNPAKLPENFPPKLKEKNSVFNIKNEPSSVQFVEKKALQSSSEPEDLDFKSQKEETIDKEDINTDDGATVKISTTNLKENSADNNLQTEPRLIASFEEESKIIKEPNNENPVEEVQAADISPVTFYHDVKVADTAPVEEIKVKVVTVPKKTSWFKKLLSFFFGEKEKEPVLLPYSIEHTPQNKSIIDADFLPESIREKLLKEKDLYTFKANFLEIIIKHSLPQKIENLLKDFVDEFIKVQCDLDLQDHFVAFIKEPFSSKTLCSNKFKELLFALLCLEADHQGYEMAYLLVSHPKLKEQYDNLFADDEINSLTFEQRNQIVSILIDLISELYRLQSYCLSDNGSLCALICENSTQNNELHFKVMTEDSVMGQTIKVKIALDVASNQNIVIKSAYDGRLLKLNLICSNLPLLKKAQNLKEKLVPYFNLLEYTSPLMQTRLGVYSKNSLEKQSLFKDGLICLQDNKAANPLLRHQMDNEDSELIECLLKLLRELNMCQVDEIGHGAESLAENEEKLRQILALRHVCLQFCA